MVSDLVSARNEMEKLWERYEGTMFARHPVLSYVAVRIEELDAEIEDLLERMLASNLGR